MSFDWFGSHIFKSDFTDGFAVSQREERDACRLESIRCVDGSLVAAVGRTLLPVSEEHRNLQVRISQPKQVGRCLVESGVDVSPTRERHAACTDAGDRRLNRRTAIAQREWQVDRRAAGKCDDRHRRLTRGEVELV